MFLRFYVFWLWYWPTIIIFYSRNMFFYKWKIAIYSTAIKSILCHEKTRDILFLERPQGAREIKFREFSSDIKGLLAVGYVVLSHEAGWIDEVEHEFDMNLTKKKLPWNKVTLFHTSKAIYIPLLLWNKVKISSHTNNGGNDIISYQMG